MKKKLTSKSFLFKLRVSTAAVFLLTGVAAVLLAAITTAPAVGKVDFVPGGATPTPTPTPTCSWLTGQDLPSVGTRLVGVFFSGNFNHSRTPSPTGFAGVQGATPPPPAGKFYAMGGRSSDNAGSDFMHPFEYTPILNSWTTKSATYPDNQVNNMACGALSVNGADYIYCVGGSAAGATTA